MNVRADRRETKPCPAHFISLYQERTDPELFDQLFRGRHQHKRIPFRFIIYHASDRADADKVIGHHLPRNAEKED